MVEKCVEILAVVRPEVGTLACFFEFPDELLTMRRGVAPVEVVWLGGGGGLAATDDEVITGRGKGGEGDEENDGGEEADEDP